MGMSSVIKTLPERKLNHIWSSVGIFLHHNQLIFEVVYNSIMVYKAVHVIKGLERAFICQREFFKDSGLYSIRSVTD